MAVRDHRLAQLALFAALAVVHTWPLASAPGRLTRLDNADTALNTFIVAWVARQAPRAPLALFDAPVFHPERLALAYSEHITVPALMGAPLLNAGADPVLVYNLLALAGLTLSAWAMSLVVTRWTGSVAGGLVAGALFAFNAHLLTRLPHLQALHVEFLPLALLALDRLLTDGRWRDALGLTAAFVAQALCSNHTLVFLAAALVVSVAVRPAAWRGRARLIAPKLAVAGAASVVLLAPFLWPYYVVSREQGLVRSLDEVRLYSAGALDYLATAGRLHYDLWSHRVFEGRTALFPGLTALALALAAGGAAWRDGRARAALAFGAVGIALSFGPALPGYAWLYNAVPLVQGIRGAARWGFLGLTAVAILAGFGAARLDRRLASSPYRAAVIVGLLGLVTLEALRAPMGFTARPVDSPVYDVLAAEPAGALVEFPIFAEENVALNARYLVPAARHFRPLVNGYSGFEPATFVERARTLRTFPASPALTLLRGLGVRYVMVHVDAMEQEGLSAETAAAASSAALTLLAAQPGVRLYRLE